MSEAHSSLAEPRSARRLIGTLLLALLPAFGSAWAQVPADPFQYSRDSVMERDPANGRVTAVTLQPGQPQSCLRTEYLYDDYGNRRKTTQKNCVGATGTALFPVRELTEEYLAEGGTPKGIAPTLTTNAEGHIEHTQVSPSFGARTSHRDVNNLQTVIMLDEFGRKVSEIRPDGNQRTWTYNLCPVFGGSSTDCSSFTAAGAVVSYYIRMTPRNASGVQNGPIQTSYFDTENREIRQEVEAFATGVMRISVIERQYDAAGRLFREVGPYFAGGSAAEWVEWTYDELGRVRTESRPNPNAPGGVAVASTEYNGRSTLQTNALGQTLIKERNEYDQVFRVTDTQGNQISYLPDAFGNVVVIQDPKGNISVANYDMRGSRVGLIDPDMGSWIYEVDAVGQVVRQVSPKNLSSTMEYDRLGRLVRRTEPDLDSFWFYDVTAAKTACGYSLGLLCESTTSTGYRLANNYDALARLTSSTVTLGGGADGAFVGKVRYNADGRIDQQIWPTGFAVKRTYNDRGVLLDLRNVATDQIYWQRLEGNARGDAVRIALGNNLTDLRQVDAQTGNVTGIQSTGAAGVILDQSFSYNAINNLNGRSDALQHLNEAFGYDRLNRLTAQLVQSPSVSRVVFYQYDALGNITYNSDVGSYNYVPVGNGPTRPHAVKQVSGQTGKFASPIYQYDAHGNIETVAGTNGVTRTHVWTSFDSPQSLSLSPGGVSSTFWYGPEHQRIKQTVIRNGQSRTVLYLHPDNEGALYFERELQGTGGVATNRHFLLADSNVTLQIESPGGVAVDPVPTNVTGLQYRYWHKDPLGSVVAVTDGVGGVLERLSYDPFGKRRSPAGAYDQAGSIDAVSTKRGFTGHEHLDEIEYIHMNARIYDPDIGRFLSADPTIPSVHHLQSFNRYSYARNNPLNRVDPNGFDDSAEGESSEMADKPTNSLSKDSVGNQIANTANGKSTSPTQSNAKAAKAQPGTQEGATPGQEQYGIMSERGKLAAKLGAQAVEEAGWWGLGEGLGRMVGPALGWASGKVRGLLGSGAATAEKAVAAEVNQARVASLPKVNITASKSISVATSSGTGKAGPMQVTRIIKRGENVSDIINEAKGLTHMTGNEHAVVTLANGERAIVSGSPDGIEFAEGSISKIFGHTHPTNAMPSDADAAALRALGQTKQYVFHGGQVSVVRSGH
ncbi:MULTISPECIES: RHS repeat domain-containing protein [unclassified Rhizobacter]|uniref:RHS repeat domain-containing protein n=1 Tax=unclassified Rhizobacter TaxID=2640088 RepID=UPI00138F6ECF|nr:MULTISPECIES: RHS repeat-associated core domain-containing protein [unclassified Rhizobacter]